MTEGEKFGAALKMLRAAMSLTLEKLAARAGLDTRTLSRIERGGCKNLPQPATQQRLADALGVTLDKLAPPQPEDAEDVSDL